MSYVRANRDREDLMNAGRLFLVWIMLAAAIATPAFGQAPSSVAKPAASIPDFSGVWAHPFLTGYEPPASGPGPVLNTARSPNGVANFRRLIGDYNNPILKPHAAERVKQFGEMTKAGGGYPTPSNQCWPGGVHYAIWALLVQLFKEPD